MSELCGIPVDQETIKAYYGLAAACFAAIASMVISLGTLFLTRRFGAKDKKVDYNYVTQKEIFLKRLAIYDEFSDFLDQILVTTTLKDESRVIAAMHNKDIFDAIHSNTLKLSGKQRWLSSASSKVYSDLCERLIDLTNKSHTFWVNPENSVEAKELSQKILALAGKMSVAIHREYFNLHDIPAFQKDSTELFDQFIKEANKNHG